jgi:hypothetical protein
MGSEQYRGGIRIVTLDCGQQIDLRHESRVLQFVPTEFYIKPDGAQDGTPSLLIVMRHPVGVAFGQISYSMLKPVIAELERVVVQQRSLDNA